MLQRKPWFFLTVATVLVTSFFSYGYRILAAGAQEREEIEIIRRTHPEGVQIFSNDMSSRLSGGGYLGVSLADISSSDLEQFGLQKEEGVLINRVEKASPAEEAGLQEKDVVLVYAGNPVFSAAQFSRLVNETPAGRKVAVTVLRQKKKVELQARIGKRAEVLQSEIIRKMPDLKGLPPLDEKELPEGVYMKRRLAEPVPFMERKPRLGISVLPMTDQLAPKFGVKDGGLLVTEVQKESVSDKAGLLAGDVILEIDGIRVTEVEEINRVLDRSEGRTLEVKILRDQKPLTLKAQFPEPEKKSIRKSGSRIVL